MRVLMINRACDDDILRQPICDCLTALDRAGFEVSYKSTIVSTFHALQQKIFDVIIFDMVVPYDQVSRDNSRARQYDPKESAGKILAKELRERFPDLPMLCYRIDNSEHQIDPELNIPTFLMENTRALDLVRYVNEMLQPAVGA